MRVSGIARFFSASFTAIAVLLGGAYVAYGRHVVGACRIGAAQANVMDDGTIQWGSIAVHNTMLEHKGRLEIHGYSGSPRVGLRSFERVPTSNEADDWYRCHGQIPI